MFENNLQDRKFIVFFSALVLSLLALFLAAKTWLAIREAQHVGEPIPYEYSISIEGLGEADVVPDVAKISYTIESRGATTEEAQNKNATVGNSIIDRLGQEGIDKKDVKTTYYSSYQNYKYDALGNSIPGGDWTTTQSVEVTVRDTTKTSSLLSLVGQLGATGISGPTFEIDDEEPAKNEARKLALEDAKEKAQEIAASLGLKLKAISSYSEWQDQPYYGYEMGSSYEAMDTKAGASPTVEAGQQKVKIHVTISYTLE